MSGGFWSTLWSTLELYGAQSAMSKRGVMNMHYSKWNNLNQFKKIESFSNLGYKLLIPNHQNFEL